MALAMTAAKAEKSTWALAPEGRFSGFFLGSWHFLAVRSVANSAKI
jgi:hypothetical protein